LINDNKSIIKLAILILFVSIGTYIFIHFDLYVYFISKKKAIALINSYSPYDVFVFIGLQILQVVFAPIPGEATGLIGGFLYGPFLGTIYSTIGLTIGSWAAFITARFFGLPFVEKAVNPETIKKYDYLLEHKGAVIAFVLFLLPGFPKDYLCFIMGLSHMRIGMFLLVSTVGRLFGTILLSVCGSYARNNEYAALFIAFGITGVILLIAYLYKDKWLAALKKRHLEKHH
jgi:uncharacterized membrane protein YdjX (TVP38/TMEM64 family)